MSCSKLCVEPIRCVEPPLINVDWLLQTGNLVDREGFEPSYLARRDRFTVCWL